MDPKEIGVRGEDAAAAYLQRTGMTVIDRNWRVAAGEIDVVALDGDTLVLCEVKTRRSKGRGTPEEAVSAAKRRKLSRLAVAYVGYAGMRECPVRFDVITIRVLSDDRALLRHHRAAFVIE